MMKDAELEELLGSLEDAKVFLTERQSAKIQKLIGDIQNTKLETPNPPTTAMALLRAALRIFEKADASSETDGVMGLKTTYYGTEIPGYVLMEVIRDYLIEVTPKMHEKNLASENAKLAQEKAELQADLDECRKAYTEMKDIVQDETERHCATLNTLQAERANRPKRWRWPF